MVGSPPSSRASDIFERSRKSSAASNRSSGMYLAAAPCASIASLAKQNEQLRLHVAVSEILAIRSRVYHCSRGPTFLYGGGDPPPAAVAQRAALRNGSWLSL